MQHEIMTIAKHILLLPMLVSGVKNERIFKIESITRVDIVAITGDSTFSGLSGLMVSNKTKRDEKI